MTVITDTIPRIVEQRKQGRAWETISTATNSEGIYYRLAAALANKKINACTYIKSISRYQAYDHVEITVTYDNGCRTIYYLPEIF